MKIGQFATNHKVSIDTVRHYMDMKLLLPTKDKAHYDFDSRCSEDLEVILKLKEFGFSLSEIKSMFSFMRIGRLTNYQENDIYRNIFKQRLEMIKRDLERLSINRDKLKEALEEMQEIGKSSKTHSYGIPIDSLNLFACSTCRGRLSIQSTEVVDNEIIEGELTCSCGKRYPVINGILHANEKLKEEQEYNYIVNIHDYILETPQEYIDRLYSSIGWGFKLFNQIEQKGKVALELGTGLGVFLRNIYDELDDEMTYFAVDHNSYSLEFLREILSRADKKKKIVFIASDFLSIPIKEHCIDYIFDIAGTSNYSFEHKEFLIDSVDKYSKEKSLLMGSYLVFDNFVSDSDIEIDRQWLFKSKNIEDSIQRLGYEIVETRSTDQIDNGGKYENFFKKGEKISALLIAAKR